MSSKKIQYREKEDILYLNLGESSHESIPRGGFILDLDGQGKVVGVEILEATEMFDNLEVEDVDRFLNSLVDGDIVVREKMGVSWVILKLYSIIEGEKVEETFRFEVPAPNTDASPQTA